MRTTGDHAAGHCLLWFGFIAAFCSGAVFWLRLIRWPTNKIRRERQRHSVKCVQRRLVAHEPGERVEADDGPTHMVSKVLFLSDLTGRTICSIRLGEETCATLMMII